MMIIVFLLCLLSVGLVVELIHVKKELGKTVDRFRIEETMWSDCLRNKEKELKELKRLKSVDSTLSIMKTASHNVPPQEVDQTISSLRSAVEAFADLTEIDPSSDNTRTTNQYGIVITRGGADLFFYNKRPAPRYTCDFSLDSKTWISAMGLEDLDGIIERGYQSPVFSTEEELWSWAKVHLESFVHDTLIHHQLTPGPKFNQELEKIVRFLATKNTKPSLQRVK